MSTKTGKNVAGSKQAFEINYPNFPLHEYASQYEGYSRINRLLFIAQRCPDQQVQAYRLAIEGLKAGQNAQMYINAVAMAREALGDALGDDWGLDSKWVETTKRLAHEKTVRLQAVLAEAKRIGEREPTRLAYIEVGDHQLAIGEFDAALSTYLESKDAYTNKRHIVEGCLSIVNTSIAMGSMSYVKSQAARAQSLDEVKAKPVWNHMFNAAQGLYSIKTGNFAAAAPLFISIGTNLEQQYAHVISQKDVAIFAAVCALVSSSRRELIELVKRKIFKDQLELVPVWKKIITDFSNSKYASCFALLETQTNDLLLDQYLHPHVHVLLAQIRDKALMQYFRPFTAVHLPTMAAAVNMTVPGLEAALVNLIADGKIQARIDSANKILYSRHADQRHVTFQQALLTGQVYVRDVRALLLRMSLGEHDFVIRHPKAGKLRREGDGDEEMNAPIQFEG